MLTQQYAPPRPWSSCRSCIRLLGQQLFYILGVCFTLLFLFISLILRSAPLGLANWGTRPERVVGWLSFVAIESYGSLAVALFWAFTNSTVDLEAAKASYGLVIAGAQIGAIIGMCGPCQRPVNVEELVGLAAGCFGFCLRVRFLSSIPDTGRPLFGSVEFTIERWSWDGLLCSLFLLIGCSAAG